MNLQREKLNKCTIKLHKEEGLVGHGFHLWFSFDVKYKTIPKSQTYELYSFFDKHGRIARTYENDSKRVIFDDISGVLKTKYEYLVFVSFQLYSPRYATLDEAREIWVSLTNDCGFMERKG